jgi:hypothetical protein
VAAFVTPGLRFDSFPHHGNELFLRKLLMQLPLEQFVSRTTPSPPCIQKNELGGVGFRILGFEFVWDFGFRISIFHR